MLKRLISIICVCFLILTAVIILDPSKVVDAQKMTDFNGVLGNSITFGTTGGNDTSTQINIEKKSAIYNATFQLQGKPDGNGDYPINVTVDVGNDYDIQWAWKGTGYGALGQQTIFNESQGEYLVSFNTTGGFVKTKSILLPKSAVVTSAKMDVTGIGGGYSFPGEGLMIKLVAAGTFKSDTTSSQVCYTTSSTDATNKFVQQWYSGGSGTRSNVISGFKIMRGTTVIEDAVPTSPTGPSNCIPFGAGGSYGPHTGFIYKNIDPFIIQTGDEVCFDLAAANDVNVIMDLYMAHTTTNGGTTIDSDDYTQVCFAADGGKGNAVTNDFELKFKVTDIGGGPGPSNATVNIGNNGGTAEWNKTGPYNLTETIPDFATELNNLLTTLPVAFTDLWGNQMVQIPINTTSDSAGCLKFTNISINYTYHAPVNFTSELQQLIPATGEGNVTVPIRIHSEGPGVVDVFGLDIDFEPPNKAPTIDPIPDAFMNEDSVIDELVNLTDYVRDDRDLNTDLVYQVESQTRTDVATAYIYNANHFGVNATKMPNWNGDFMATIRATDTKGKFTVSNTFKITINPINDEPTRKEIIPNITLNEDDSNANTVYLNATTTTYFSDIDSNLLYFEVALDPANEYDPDPPVTYELKPVKDREDVISVSATDNWNGQIGLRVYADDDITFEHALNPFWDLTIIVNPVNDAPVWKKIPEATLTEDTPALNYVILTDYLTDVDNNVSDIDLSITSYTNPSRLKVEINDGNGLDIIPGLDFAGTSKINLAANDGAAKSYISFNATIQAVNDRPTVKITSIKEGDVLEDEVSIGGLASDAENKLSVVEISVNGSDWLSTTGTTSWTAKFDTTTLPNGPITIEARAFDSELYSIIALINATIDNPIIVDLPPIVIITSHINGTNVSGSFKLKGTASDPESAIITSLEYSFGTGMEWQSAASDDDFATWEFPLDVSLMMPGSLVISIRAYDGANYGYATINLVVGGGSTDDDTDDDVDDDTDDDVDDDIVNPDDDDIQDERGILDYWWIFLIIALVLIIIVVIIIVIIVARRKAKKDEPAPAPALQPMPPQPMGYAQPMNGQPMQPSPYAAPMMEQPPQQMMGAQQSPYQAAAFAPGPAPSQQLGGYPQQPMLMLPPGPAPPPDYQGQEPIGLEAPPSIGEPMPAPQLGTVPEPMPQEQPQAPPQLPASSDIDSLFTSLEAPPPVPAPMAQPESLQTACHNCGELMLVTITQKPMIIKCWKCGAEGMIE